jgi:hypothetical protein
MSADAWDRPGIRGTVDRTIGPLLWRPWYDRVATSAVSRVFFPLSRAWAAARLAAGDVERFAAEAGARRSVGPRLLKAVASADRRAAKAQAAWDAGFFADAGDLPPARLAGLERARLTAIRRLMALRAGFLPGHLEKPFPAVRFDIEAAESVAARHGPRQQAADAGLTPDLSVPVRESGGFERRGIRWQWLRFEAPAEAGPLPTAEARVRTPAHRGRAPRGTVVFAHGIAMEPEYWGESGTLPDWFLEQGFRVLEPMGPWHARRCPPGRYGGERVFACGPGGLLDYSWVHVRELGRMIAWAHETSQGAPVLVGGISLGALTAMQLLSWCGGWPAAAKPDCGLLIAPAASLEAVAYRGALTGGIGVPETLRAAGWTEDAVAPWAPLLDARPAPGLAPGRIVLVLGDVDAITPYESGLDLARTWQIPDSNLWTRNQGHFSVSLGITAAPDPLHRAADLLREG